MQEIVCGNCGNRLSVPDHLQNKAVRCPYCKTRIDVGGPSGGGGLPEPPPSAPTSPQWREDEEDDLGDDDYDDRPRRRWRRGPSKGDGQATTALVTGICALVLQCLCGAFGTPITIPLSITAIICGSLGMKSENKRGSAIAGLVLGIIALLIAIAAIIIVIYMINNDPNFMKEFGR
jgi:DNA-directed RNA polymerase subunit RPC12/RpoP